MPHTLTDTALWAHLQHQADLPQLAAESRGWQPLADGAYLHMGAKDDAEQVIHVVGLPDMALPGLNLLLLC